MDITQIKEWRELESHYQKLKKTTLRKLFTEVPSRTSKFKFRDCGWFVDASKNIMTETTLELLLKLARFCKLEDEIEAMFSGQKINGTENRAVLHTALRNCSNTPVILDGKDVMPDINNVLTRMEELAEKIRTGHWTGFTGKRLRNIIGIWLHLR